LKLECQNLPLVCAALAAGQAVRTAKETERRNYLLFVMVFAVTLVVLVHERMPLATF
jgi:hypothetical protein